MAHYVYHCEPCRIDFEVEKSMQRAATGEACPQCGRPGRRIYTAPAVQSKGTVPAFNGPESGPGTGACNGNCCGGACGLEA